MNDVAPHMLAELRRIRELLTGNQSLGFGKKQTRSYIFFRHSPKSLWYTRDRQKAVNVPIPERDVTGYLSKVWRYDRQDQSNNDLMSELMVEIDADRPYII